MRTAPEVARAGETAVSGDRVLWRPWRRTGNEGFSSQDKTLVFPGVFPCPSDPADRRLGCWGGLLWLLTDGNRGIAHSRCFFVCKPENVFLRERIDFIMTG